MKPKPKNSYLHRLLKYALNDLDHRGRVDAVCHLELLANEMGQQEKAEWERLISALRTHIAH